MTRAKDMAGLAGLAQLLLDHRLSQLREAANRREQSRTQIAALDLAAEPADLPPVAAGQVALRYQLWADTRRSELNALLARQTVDWMEARDAARNASGRTQALQAIAGRLAARR